MVAAPQRSNNKECSASIRLQSEFFVLQWPSFDSSDLGLVLGGSTKTHQWRELNNVECPCVNKQTNRQLFECQWRAFPLCCSNYNSLCSTLGCVEQTGSPCSSVSVGGARPGKVLYLQKDSHDKATVLWFKLSCEAGVVVGCCCLCCFVAFAGGVCCVCCFLLVCAVVGAFNKSNNPIN